ncbi:hypothetical protein [Aequorivita capsosiphonis]|uniref:hypothetical protein n=1 Tax=Aequorivita capsosiphonis TaxID=487317 RepID=UPI0003F75543|nr:hypothetical protein [Aequorivita capsosiphonis]
MENQRNQQNQQGGQKLENKWNNIKTSYREKYPNLTEEDVNYREGEFDDMTQRVAQRTNRDREQVRNEIRDWQNKSWEEE